MSKPFGKGNAGRSPNSSSLVTLLAAWRANLYLWIREYTSSHLVVGWCVSCVVSYVIFLFLVPRSECLWFHLTGATCPFVGLFVAHWIFAQQRLCLHPTAASSSRPPLVLVSIPYGCALFISSCVTCTSCCLASVACQAQLPDEKEKEREKERKKERKREKERVRERKREKERERERRSNRLTI